MPLSPNLEGSQSGRKQWLKQLLLKSYFGSVIETYDHVDTSHGLFPVSLWETSVGKRPMVQAQITSLLSDLCSSSSVLPSDSGQNLPHYIKDDSVCVCSIDSVLYIFNSHLEISTPHDSWSVYKTCLLNGRRWSHCDLEKVNQFSQGHMVREHIRARARPQFWYMEGIHCVLSSLGCDCRPTGKCLVSLWRKTHKLWILLHHASSTYASKASLEDLPARAHDIPMIQTHGTWSQLSRRWVKDPSLCCQRSVSLITLTKWTVCQLVTLVPAGGPQQAIL
jgi:hypothetical protein